MAEKADKKSPAARTLLPLSEPAEWRGETLTELSYRPAKGGEMRRALNETKSGERYAVLMEACFGMPAAFFDTLPAADYMAITDILDGFFSRRPQA